MQTPELEQAIKSIRHQCTTKWSEQVLKAIVPPIRGMARLTREAQNLALEECTRRGLSREQADKVVASTIVDRTIGDVDVRAIREEGFTDLAEKMGLVIPGEQARAVNSISASGRGCKRSNWHSCRNTVWISGCTMSWASETSLLREQLCAKMSAEYGLTFPVEQVFLSLGGINGMDRTIRMLPRFFSNQGLGCVFGFPAPGFAIAKWQAEATGTRVSLIETAEEADYKVTPAQLHQVLQKEPDLPRFVSDRHEQSHGLFLFTRRADRSIPRDQRRAAGIDHPGRPGLRRNGGPRDGQVADAGIQRLPRRRANGLYQQPVENLHADG